MEGFDWSGLLNQVVPALGGVLVGAFAIGFARIGKLVKATDNKIDDAVWTAVTGAMEQVLEGKSAPPSSAHKGG